MNEIHKIIFGKMKDIKNFKDYELMAKLKEEFEEVEKEFYFNSENKEELVSEIFDIMQVGYTWLMSLGLDKIEIQDYNIKHLEKLKNRGYIE